MPLTLKPVLPILLAVLFTVSLIIAGQYGKKLSINVSEFSFINQQFNYQILLLLISGVSIFTSYLLNKPNFHNYFSLGDFDASGHQLKFFGIKKGDSWLKTGISLCIVISAATSLFLYFQLRDINPNWKALRSVALWITLFSLANSFGEEMIFRLGIVSPLSDSLPPLTIFFVSAVLFGLPHFAGMPNGIIGATMAGLLGFILAKSMYETNGFFWAWIIHFIQDILIISTLFLLSSSNQQ